jgi:hypothetical protein
MRGTTVEAHRTSDARSGEANADSVHEPTQGDSNPGHAERTRSPRRS